MRVKAILYGFILTILLSIASLCFIIFHGLDIGHIKLTPLEIKNLKLKNLTEIEIGNILYQSSILSVNISNLKLGWSWKMLTDKVINQCMIDSIKITISNSPGDQESSDEVKAKKSIRQIPFSINSLAINSILLHDFPYELKILNGVIHPSDLKLSATLIDPEKQKLNISEIQYSLENQDLKGKIQTEGFLIDFISPQGSVKGQLKGTSAIAFRGSKNISSSADFEGKIQLAGTDGMSVKSEFALILLNNQFNLLLSELEWEQNKERLLKTRLDSRFTLTKQNFRIDEIKIGAGSSGPISWASGWLKSNGSTDLQTAAIELNIDAIKAPSYVIDKFQTEVNLRAGLEVDTVSKIQSFRTTQVGQLRSLVASSTGTISNQTGTLIFTGYEYKNSRIPLVQTDFFLEGKELLLKVKFDEGVIHPRDYLNLFATLQSGQSTSSDEPDLPVELTAYVSSDESQGLKIVDEQFQFKIIPELKFSNPNQLEGKLRVSEGQLSISGQNLTLLQEGLIHFWPQNTGQRQSVKTTSIGKFSIQSLELDDFPIEVSASDAGLSTGVEVDLSFGSPNGNVQRTIKLEGFFPDLRVTVDGMSTSHIANAIASIFKGMGIANPGGLAASPESWLSGKAMGLASEKINEELGRLGLHINATDSSLEIQQKLGKKFMLELQQTHDEDLESKKSKKLNYQIDKTGSVYIQMNEQGSSGAGESSIGIQKKIRF